VERLILKDNVVDGLDKEVIKMYEQDEYKGNKMIVLKRDADDQYPFKFGVKKAQLILENIEGIKEFVKDNSE